MISERIRRIENLHIIFWLIKDTCWCMHLKDLAVMMVFPTVLVAIWIAIKTRKNKSELAHNLAVLFWICANSMWMIGDFHCSNCTRPYAIVLFFSGISVLMIHYGQVIYQKLKANQIHTS